MYETAPMWLVRGAQLGKMTVILHDDDDIFERDIIDASGEYSAMVWLDALLGTVSPYSRASAQRGRFSVSAYPSPYRPYRLSWRLPLSKIKCQLDGPQREAG